MSARRGATRPKSGRIDVIIKRDVAQKIINTIIEAIDADAIYRKRTFLADHIGTRCFGERLTITDRPHVVHSPYADLLDIDGVATKERVLVDRGMPTGWIGGYEECRKIGIEPTGNASGYTEVFVEPGKLSLAELCAKFPRVLVVTDFNGKGFDEETGEVSVGIEGHILENGVRTTVHEAVIAGTFFEMLKDCIPANDPDPESSVHVPSLYVGEMQLSGI
jgi:PmbA protein